jgi:predicted phage baseplate assembly protein
VQWELLQRDGADGHQWTRLSAHGADDQRPYGLDRTGVLEFPLDEAPSVIPDGVWLRGVLRRTEGGPFPVLPPVTHVLFNTVDARNLHGFRMERFSGEGVPHQVLQLRHFPVYLPRDQRDRFADLHVTVDEGDGEPRVWRVALGNALASAGKDDRVFQVDPVEGTLTFGNGIRGKILPIGAFNVNIVAYHTVPGAAGNVGAQEVVVPEGFADLVDVRNVLAAHGGRNAESIDEIIRRAPSILSSRDRAVTRQDFEIIATEASSEVARAACGGGIGGDGGIEVVILPRRRDEEDVPDPFLAAGLKDHVQDYLQRRCLVNVWPRVRLATFQPVDLMLQVRLRPNANPLAAREAVVAWVRRFLDPYEGGLDGNGWPFGATVYAQDLGRLVRDVPDVRHVVEVRLYPLEAARLAAGPVAAGWETGAGVDALTLVDADLPILREIRVKQLEDRS